MQECEEGSGGRTDEVKALSALATKVGDDEVDAICVATELTVLTARPDLRIGRQLKGRST